MTPSFNLSIDLTALIEYAERFGRFGLTELERAVLDGIVSAYVETYLRWHRAVWS